jgi:hypothetical protein
VAVVHFRGKIAPEFAVSLWVLGFRWNGHLGQWEGEVEFADAKKAVVQAGGRMRKVDDA